MENEKKNNSGWWGLLVILGLIYFTSNSDSVRNDAVKSEATPNTVLILTPAPTSIPNTPTTFISKETYYYPNNFNGYECTEDCSGHEAGYEWAEENGIESTDDCGGNSNSFIEGCESYVEENYYYDEEEDCDYEY